MRKVLAVLAIPVTISVLSGCGGGAHASSLPDDFTGKWYQTNAKSTGVNMTAEITAGHIQINNVPRSGTSAIYWLGTFDTDKSTSKAFKTKSLGDQDAMAMSIFASQDETKQFTYKDGVISFKYSILGTTSTVKLAKRSKPTPTRTRTVTPTAHVPGVKSPSSKVRTQAPKKAAPAAPKVSTRKK